MGKNDDVDPSGTYDPDEPGSMPHAAEDTEASELVTVYPAEGKNAETAQALLDAAGEGNESVVQFRDGAFEVPADVAKAAKLPEADSEDAPAPKRRAPAKSTA